MNRLTFTVINDLTYDQRMHRICSSLAKAGYYVTLIGRRLPNSLAIKNEVYKQRRIACFFLKGKLMYLEFNLRLLFYLLFIPAHCFCAIDLDTIVPNYIASIVKRKKRVYDAHELFTELKEIVTRPAIHKAWVKIEQFALPKYRFGYTVNNFIADEFKIKYGVEYAVIRNLPNLSTQPHNPDRSHPFIIYQGAVNEGRSFETLIPAMKLVNARLVIYGNGNFFKQVEQLIKDEGVQEKVTLMGMVPPEELKKITPTAYAAVMLFEETGLNQYQSLANRFFDYIMAGVPQVCVDFPQYRAINDQYGIASLISNNNPATIAHALNNLLNDDVYYETICANCLKAREELNWQDEEKVLLAFYEKVFAKSDE
ncbi:MAG: glycosyltransferase [Segetibacter sp.]